MSVYNCKTVPLQKLIPTPSGFVTPLCDSCRCKDCENPIEPKTMSVLGVNKETRVYVTAYTVSAVIDCDGYVK